jgi:hypothetical protein
LNVEELDPLCNKSIGSVRWFAGKRREDWEWREGRGSPDGVELVRRRLQICGATARDFTVLAAARAEKQKGERKRRLRPSYSCGRREETGRALTRIEGER